MFSRFPHLPPKGKAWEFPLGQELDQIAKLEAYANDHHRDLHMSSFLYPGDLCAPDIYKYIVNHICTLRV